MAGIYHCRETAGVLFKADKRKRKTPLVRITEGVSLPRLTEVSTTKSWVIHTSASASFSQGNSALGAEWSGTWSTSASQLQPAIR